MDNSQADPLRWKALVLLGAAQFMVVLDASIVNVALPSIQTDLGISQQNLQWVVSAYTLTFGGFLLLGGRLADLLGRRSVFVAGLGLFSVASLVGGFATSEATLIAARAVQGLGAAIVSPAALSIVTTTFTEGSERNKALGIWGALAGAGGAVGVLAGGLLTEGLGWEWVLFVNFPIGAAVALLAPRFVRQSKAVERTSFDVLGALSVTAGLVALVYALVDAEDAGWGSGQTIGLLVLAAVLIGAFLAIEHRSKHPLMPLRFFRNRPVSSANAAALLVGASLFSMFYFISLYLQQVLGYDALDAGLAYLPLSAAIIVSAGVASQLVTRSGPKPVLATGLGLVAAGLLWFTQVDAGGGYVSDVLFPSLVAAVGLGFAFVPLTITAVSGVKESESGLASGLINTAQQVGGALGLAILSTIATSTTSDVAPGPNGRPTPEGLTEGFQAAFATGAAFAAVGFVLVLLAVPKISGREAAAAPAAA